MLSQQQFCQVFIYVVLYSLKSNIQKIEFYSFLIIVRHTNQCHQRNIQYKSYDIRCYPKNPRIVGLVWRRSMSPCSRTTRWRFGRFIGSLSGFYTWGFVNITICNCLKFRRLRRSFWQAIWPVYWAIWYNYF